MVGRTFILNCKGNYSKSWTIKGEILPVVTYHNNTFYTKSKATMADTGSYICKSRDPNGKYYISKSEVYVAGIRLHYYNDAKYVYLTQNY